MRETRPRPQPGADPRSTRERLENGPVALHAGRVGNRGPREDAAQGRPRPPRAAGGGNGRSELEPTGRDASVNPHLESRVIGSGALPHDEKPEEFEALVREWLGRIEPRL